MEKPVRIFIVSLLFIGFLLVVLEGFEDGKGKEEPTTKDRVTTALIKGGIPPSNVIISNGSEVKKALNIQGAEPQDTSRVALVMYAKPSSYTYPEGINKVIFTALSADDSLDGVLAFDTTHKGTDPSSSTIIYATRLKAEGLMNSGLDPVKIYNQWEAFTVSKLDVASSQEVIADELSRYDLDVKAIGVVNWSDIRGRIPIDEPYLGNDSRVAFIYFQPRNNGTAASVEALVIIDVAFAADPSLGAVMVNDLDRMKRTGNVSLYYMDRETYNTIAPQTTVEEATQQLSFKEYPAG